MLIKWVKSGVGDLKLLTGCHISLVEWITFFPTSPLFPPLTGFIIVTTKQCSYCSNIFKSYRETAMLKLIL